MMFDITVIGGGPAGLSAALYAKRFGLNILVITKELGGSIVDSYSVENYLGFGSVDGEELIKRFKKHCDDFHVEFEFDNVLGIDGENDDFVVYTDHSTYLTKKVILALGTNNMLLGVKGEKEFIGNGIGFCAVCDCMFFKDKKVIVVGGGDSALSTALMMKRHTKDVLLVVREDVFTAQPMMKNLVKDIDVIFDQEIVEFMGTKRLKSVKFKDGTEMNVDGVFIRIGSKPDINLLSHLYLDVDDEGYVKIDARMETSRRGIYCAGDVTNGSNKLKQLTTAVAEGSIAAHSAYEDLV